MLCHMLVEIWNCTEIHMISIFRKIYFVEGTWNIHQKVRVCLIVIWYKSICWKIWNTFFIFDANYFTVHDCILLTHRITRLIYVEFWFLFYNRVMKNYNHSFMPLAIMFMWNDLLLENVFCLVCKVPQDCKKQYILKNNIFSNVVAKIEHNTSQHVVYIYLIT